MNPIHNEKFDSGNRHTDPLHSSLSPPIDPEKAITDACQIATQLIEKGFGKEALAAICDFEPMVDKTASVNLRRTAMFYTLLGFAYELIGDELSAELNYAKGLRLSKLTPNVESALDPRCHTLHLTRLGRLELSSHLARIYIERKDSKNALCITDEAIKEWTSDEAKNLKGEKKSEVLTVNRITNCQGIRKLWYFKACAHDEENQFEEAEKAARKCEELFAQPIECDPIRLSNLHMLSLVLLKLGKGYEASKVLDQCIPLAGMMEYSTEEILRLKTDQILGLCSDLRLRQAQRKAAELLHEIGDANDINFYITVTPGAVIALRHAERGHTTQAIATLANIVQGDQERAKYALSVLRLVFGTAERRGIPHIVRATYQLANALSDVTE